MIQTRPHLRASPSPPPASRDEDHPASHMESDRHEQARRPVGSHVESARTGRDTFLDEIIRGVAPPPARATILAPERITGRPGQINASPVLRVFGRREQPTLEPSAGAYLNDSDENRSGARTRGNSRPSLDRLQLLQATATHLSRLPRNPTWLRLPVRLRLRQSFLGAGNCRSWSSAEIAVRDTIASQFPNTPRGRESLRIASHTLSHTTVRTKSSQWTKFEQFCCEEGHPSLPAAPSTVLALAYIGFLFEEDRVHGPSLDHYISFIRMRQVREHQLDPCTGQVHQDLLRAFRRQDDACGDLQDVRAAIAADVVALVRMFGLQQPLRSAGERDPALIEFQFLLCWRKSSSRTVQVEDVEVFLVDSSTPSRIFLLARPRSMKGRPIRNVPASRLTCTGKTKKIH